MAGATSDATVGTLYLAAKWHASSPGPQPISRILADEPYRGPAKLEPLYEGWLFSAMSLIAVNMGSPRSDRQAFSYTLTFSALSKFCETAG